MHSAQFERLVRELEAQERRHPRWYRVRLAAMAGLGYALFLAAALLAAGLAVFAVGAAVLIRQGEWVPGVIGLVIAGGLMLLIFPMLRALLAPREAPDGLRLTAENAPALFRRIEEMRAAVGARFFHQVLLTGDDNAAVAHSLTRGTVGRQRHWLLLGLPLLQGMTAAEFEAVLAHELAHLSARDDRFSGWIYRVRFAWQTVADQWERGSKILGRRGAAFFRWFWPRFNARAIVLSRAAEYRADQLSARLMNPRTTAMALSRVHFISLRLTKEFWPALHRETGRSAEPPADLFARSARFFAIPGDESLTARRVEEMLNFRTGHADSHPALADRLEALGYPKESVWRELGAGMIDPPATSAADVFLGNHHALLAAKLGKTWAATFREAWAKRSDAVGSDTSQALPFAVDAAWKKIASIAEVDGFEAVQAAILDLLQREPTHAGAHIFRGRYLLEQDDPAGVAWLEQALTLSPRAGDPVFGILTWWHEKAGRHAEVEACRRRADAFAEQTELAALERARFSLDSPLLPHDLTFDQVSALAAALRSRPGVVQAWLVRRAVRLFPYHPDFLLLVELKPLPPAKADKTTVPAVFNELPLNGSLFPLILWKDAAALTSRLVHFPGAKLPL